MALDENMAMTAMEIVAFSGDARTKYLQSMDCMEAGDYEKAAALIKEGDDLILDAHNTQTELITKEASGEKVELSFLTVHAQDHLMTAMLARELIAELIELHAKH